MTWPGSRKQINAEMTFGVFLTLGKEKIQINLNASFYHEKSPPAFQLCNDIN